MTHLSTARTRRFASRWVLPRQEWLLLGLLAACLLVGVRSCWPVAALDLAWSDRLQALQLRSLDPGPVGLVTLDGMKVGALGAGERVVIDKLVASLLDDGAIAVGLYVSATDFARAWPQAPAIEGPRWLLLLWRQPTDTALVMPADTWPDADGVVRRVYLRQWVSGEDQLMVHGAWTLLQIANLAPRWPAREAPAPGRALPDGLPGTQPAHPVGVPYGGPPGRMSRVAHERWLRGEVPQGTFRDRVVLLGALGAGANLQYTAAGGRLRPMAGVERLAHVVDALLRVGALGAMPNALAHGLGLALLVPWWLALGGLGVLGWLVAAASTVAVALLAEALLQSQFLLIWGPAPTIVVVLVCTTLWILWRYVQAVAALTSHVPSASDPQSSLGARTGDPLQQRVQAVLAAQERQTRDYQWCLDLLHQMPDATLACGTNGTVRRGNLAAARMLGLGAAPKWPDWSLEDVLGVLLADGDTPGRHLTPARRLCQAVLVVPPVHSQHECVDRHGRDLLIKVAPAFDHDQVHVGWLLTLLDISLFRSRQRQRDDELHFLGHDLRGPQSAALAVMELARQQGGQVDVMALIDRVERHLRRALSLSDGFVQLLRAQDGQLHLEPLDLVALLDEVVDEHWDRARLRNVDLACVDTPDEALALADREMLGRALGNLVSNAVKFTLVDTAVRARIVREGGFWVVEISDQGPGISYEDQVRLFRPFTRAKRTRHVDGAGLGLPMVKAVIDRHQGRVEVRSQLEQGTTFRVVLPVVEEGL